MGMVFQLTVSSQGKEDVLLTLSIIGAMALYLAWGTYRCMKTELPDLVDFEEEKGE